MSGTALNITGVASVQNGGTGLSTLGTPGQCHQVNGSATGLQYGSCGSSTAGLLVAANNLADIPSLVTARTNLGLGSLATASPVNLAMQVTGTLPAANVATLNQNTTGNAAAATHWPQRRQNAPARNSHRA